MAKLIGVLFLLYCSVMHCLGQKRDIDYFKTTKLSQIESEDRTSLPLKREETFTQDYTNGSFRKYVRYNTDSSLRSYSLDYINEGEDGGFYEMIQIQYAFDDGRNPFYGIVHSVIDTSRSTINRISIEKESDERMLSSNMEVSYFSNGLVETYEIPDSITAKYLDWIVEDVSKLDSMRIPPWLGSIDWKLKKLKEDLRKNTGIGHGQTTAFYTIYSSYSDAEIIVDTVFLKKVHQNVTIDNSVTRSLNVVETDSTLHHEEYYYFSDRDSTYQIMFDLVHGDTVSLILLSTVLRYKTLYSHYQIKGNPPWAIGSMYNDNYLGEVLERELMIQRNSSGFIVGGWANGVVVDDLHGNQKVRCSIVVENRGDQYVVQQTHHTGSKPFGGKVYRKINDELVSVRYDLVALYPNIDIKPLLNMRYLDHYGVMYNLNLGVTKNKRRRGKRKSGKYKPEYTVGSKRVEVNRMKKYERWEKEESRGERTVYEVYYK